MTVLDRDKGYQPNLEHKTIRGFVFQVTSQNCLQIENQQYNG